MSIVIADARFSKMARVQRVLLQRTEDEGLILSLGLVDPKDHTKLNWRFEGVRKLRFRGDFTDLLLLVRLQYEDLAPRGWEDVRYEVKDCEEEFISFYCVAIREVTIEEPG